MVSMLDPVRVTLMTREFMIKPKIRERISIGRCVRKSETFGLFASPKLLLPPAWFAFFSPIGVYLGQSRV